MELAGWQTLQIRYVDKEFTTRTPKKWFCTGQMGRTETYTLFCRTWQSELFSTLHKSHGISLSRGGKNKGFFAQYSFPIKTYTICFSFIICNIWNLQCPEICVILSLPQGTSHIVQSNFFHSVEIQCLSFNGKAKHWPGKWTQAPQLMMSRIPRP